MKSVLNIAALIVAIPMVVVALLFGMIGLTAATLAHWVMGK